MGFDKQKLRSSPYIYYLPFPIFYCLHNNFFYWGYDQVRLGERQKFKFQFRWHNVNEMQTAKLKTSVIYNVM